MHQVDKGSIGFRRWLKTRAGGGVPWQRPPHAVAVNYAFAAFLI